MLYGRTDDSIICVRVFVSSTFRGLTGVREYLRKEVFSEIELEYRKCGIGFSFVDLQWGITEEEARNGKTVELCLREIERCQPFFLGLVGTRSGWTPKPEECTFRCDRIAEFAKSQAGKTITEMEFLYNSQIADNPNDSGILLLGKELDDDYNNHSEEAVNKDASADPISDRLYEFAGQGTPNEIIHSREELKQAVRGLLLKRLELIVGENGFGYLNGCIRRNKNRQSVLENTGFCRAKDLLNIVSMAETAERSPIVITGPSGCGKSTLLAYLYETFKITKQTIIRFVYDTMLTPQDLWESIEKETGGSECDNVWVRVNPGSMHIRLMNWLSKQDRAFVLLIDDIDLCRLPTGSQKDVLDLCLKNLPKNVRLIMTAGENAFIPENHLNVRFYKLNHLDRKAKANALATMEKRIGKKFGSYVSERILASEKCNDPEYLSWLIKYLRENAVYENLAELTEHALCNLSLHALIQQALNISLRNANGNTERLYAYLALVSEGITEKELWKMVPALSGAEFYSALGKLGNAIQYDENGKMHLVNKTLKSALLTAGKLTEYASNCLLKRFLPIIAERDPQGRVIGFTGLMLQADNPEPVFAKMTDPDFCEAVVNNAGLWERVMEEAYQRKRMGVIIETLVSKHGYFLKENLYILEAFADFLERKGEYRAAIQLARWIESSLTVKVSPFNYILGSVYGRLLSLYSKIGDFQKADLILRHVGFMIQENSKHEIQPYSADFLRENFIEPIAIYAQQTKAPLDNAIAGLLNVGEMMDHAQVLVKEANIVPESTEVLLNLVDRYGMNYFVIGQLLQLDDNSQVLLTGLAECTLEEYCYATLDFVGQFNLHNRPGAIFSGGKVLPLDIGEYNFLLDCCRNYLITKRGFRYSSHTVCVDTSDDYAVYEALSNYYPKRMGRAYGFDGKQYLIYGYNDFVALDEAAYLFWLLSDGNKTVKDIAQQLVSLFTNPDNYIMLKEAGQSITMLCRKHLIWLDKKVEKEMEA